MDKKKEWTDDREGGTIAGIHEETECCADGACCWQNTPAQSEKDKDPTDT